jgi:Rrf2 family protein
MKLAVKTIYALQALVEIAQHSAEGASSAQVAKAQGIPLKFLEQILTILKRAKLVKSSRGRQGGYTLAIPANGIEVYDVVERLEGAISFTEGVKKGGPIYNTLKKSEEQAVAELKKVKLEDLITETNKREGIFVYNI